jgi:glycosyltransferase involved in cell wall biosynthesis
MKVIAINTFDIIGGAARAAYRIHHAIRNYSVDSRIIVNKKISGDWSVEGPKPKVSKALAIVRSPLVALLQSKAFKTVNPVIHSPAILPSRWSGKLNASDADIIHLHWINNEMMSISDIGKIKKPVVWTLHDMWAFCGAEHYTEDNRWLEGYTSNNRPNYEAGFDLNRWTAMRKLKHWKRPMHIVTPSRWLADCVKQSVLMRDWPISIVPNTLNTNAWQPIDKTLARQILHLPFGAPLLLFGAMGGTQDPRKGFDLLQAALNYMRGQLPGLELVVLGQLAPKIPFDLGFPVHYVGHLHDEVSLRMLYSAVDVCVVSSRQEAFGQMASESHACGCPVVAFNITGLKDVVEQGQTGYLADAYCSEDLARGIMWVLADQERHFKLSAQARQRAVSLWSNEVVVPQYLEVYERAIDLAK